MQKLFLLLLLPQLALGATISGTIYDLDLIEVHDAIVTITTEPEQRMVAKEGTYEFSVPAGRYVLIAKVNDGDYEATENISVADDGEYIVDLILIPSFEELDNWDIGDSTFDVSTGRSIPYAWLIVIGALAIVGIAMYYVKALSVRDPGNDQDEFRAAVVQALHKHNGRISQRDLRKEVPFSEAKVSLVLAELESEGKIKKIKKGRGNLILMK